MENEPDSKSQPIAFKAETRQLLEILVHSLYTERDVFLRELVSNASDALTRAHFENLTNRNILDPDVELAIWITVDNDQKTLSIRDSGIGMTTEEITENLGTIAHSGARAFIQAAQKDNPHLSDIIGQFGVGFYSAFIVAESIKVTSRSSRPEAEAVSWFSTGSDTFSVEPAEKNDRGTIVTLKLKDDALEFLQSFKLKEVIKKYSDYVAFPIYISEDKQQVNRQTALWRQQPRQVAEQEYTDFYRQLTLDPEPPLTHIHLSVDAPVQLYSILYIPASLDRTMFSLRKQDGLKLYARKVLIQEYCKDLLPEFLLFVQGVVDSEDLPLNISRESIHSNKIMVQLKKLITNKILDTLKSLAQEKPEDYGKFWQTYNRFIKQGIAIDAEYYDNLLPLLRFHTLTNPQQWVSLDDYQSQVKPDQKNIFYILGDDERSIIHSPHLEAFQHQGYDVLFLADPMDSFMLLRLTQYKELKFVNVASGDITLPEPEKEQKEEPASEQIAQPSLNELLERFKTVLGDRVADVRTTNRLVESPARLVDKEGELNPELQHVYRVLNREYEAPQKVLEINPQHPILIKLANLPADHPMNQPIIEQLYEDSLLIEGLHPDPASMIQRIQQIIQNALER